MQTPHTPQLSALAPLIWARAASLGLVSRGLGFDQKSTLSGCPAVCAPVFKVLDTRERHRELERRIAKRLPGQALVENLQGGGGEAFIQWRRRGGRMKRRGAQEEEEVEVEEELPSVTGEERNRIGSSPLESAED